MRGKLGIIAGMSGVGVLLVGVVGFFGLLVALNGYDEATGGRIILGFLVVVALSFVLASWMAYHFALRVGARAGRPLWLIGPLSILVSVVMAAIIQVIGAGALIVIFG